MTEEEYAVFYTHLVEDYAKEIARNNNSSFEDALKRSKEQTSSLLSAGLDTPDQRLWMVVADETNEAVGYLWCHVDSAKKRSFIYDIEMFEAQRGHGYGTATLNVLEEVLRSEGITHIGLHVFGDNTRAQALYNKQGYQITGISMQKKIGASET